VPKLVQSLPWHYLLLENQQFSALRRQNQWAMGSAADRERSSASLESLKARDFPAFRIKQKNELQEIIRFLKFIFLTGFKSFIF